MNFAPGATPPLEERVDVPIVVTGAAGLVGQNLVLMLSERGYRRIVALDKHESNLAILSRITPGVTVEMADIAVDGDWQRHLGPDVIVVALHAQITSATSSPFVRNNVTATQRLIEAMKHRGTRFLVHVSSSVVVSVADDDYTRTKREQEQIVRNAAIPCCVLRPTLMFGWFDPKHFGWLSRFMQRSPVFPIPGDGRYMRQPLYIRDFCRVIEWCIAHRPSGEIYDIVGAERIDYIDMVREIRTAKRLRTPILRIPYGLFAGLLRTYGMFNSKPPFTVDQLKALTAGDDFTGVDTERLFGVRQTPFSQAVRETFCDPRFSEIVVAR